MPDHVEHSPYPGPTPPIPQPTPPPLPYRRPLVRRWVHVMLLPVTFVTLAFAGGVFWEGAASPDELGRWSSLVQLEFQRRVLLAGLPYALWVIAILGSHEMGHYLACRHYGIRATLPFFIPGVPPIGSFGAVIRIRSPIPHRRALFDVAAAGPIAGFAVALPVLLAGFAIAEPAQLSELQQSEWNLGPPLVLWLVGDWMQQGPVRLNHLIGAGWVGMLVTSLNLFPVGQLDGGHAAYALGRRVHRRLTLLSMGALLTLILFQAIALRQFPAYILWFAILIWMRARHPRLLDEETISLGRGRRLLALGLLLMLFLSFIPLPFMF